jgi:two-component system, chemotaxis family, protein-glutamate methylesterase/glutaminase
MTAPARILAQPSRKAGARPIRVMLVDDSQVARSIFARLLSENDDIAVVAEAESSREALEFLRSNGSVDVILLDIEMPQRTGLEALPEIVAASKGASIVVVSSFVEENGPAAMQALSLGACDTLAKPGRAGFGEGFSEKLVKKVTRLGRRHMLDPTDGLPICAPVDMDKPTCLAIGASTGGIPVIQQLLQSLDADFSCPVFIVQHLPVAFMDFFARQLSCYTSRPVTVAKAGTVVKDSNVYIAPGDAHLVCRRAHGQVVLDHVTHYSDSRYCPSVDALFISVAEVYGAQAMAIILSGMGNDGVAGARILSSRKATILVQDPHSAVVWGMPGAVARENLASAILSPSELSATLARVAQQ